VSKEIENAVETFTLWRSGFVNRYHSHHEHSLRNSADLTDAHSARIVKLLLSLFKKEVDLQTVLYIIMHDAPEFAAGDSPHHAKNKSPELKKALDNLESNEMKRFEFHCSRSFTYPAAVTDRQKDIVRMLDQLDSLLFQASIKPERMGQEQTLIAGILSQASKLGVRQDVGLLILRAFRFYGSNYDLGSNPKTSDMEMQSEAYRV